MKGPTLTPKELARLQALNGVMERLWPVTKAAEVPWGDRTPCVGLLAAYRRERAAALAHGNRGRIPPNATPTEIRQRVLAVVRDRYGGVNHTHLAELLAERAGLVLSRSTMRPEQHPTPLKPHDYQAEDGEPEHAHKRDGAGARRPVNSGD